MKNINKTTVIIALSSLVIGLLFGWVFFGMPNSNEEHNHDETSESESVWTCSMHPQIRQSEAGQCPICGMDLIPLDTDNGNVEDPMAIRMSPTAMQLASVQTEIVSKKVPVNTIRLEGKIQPNEELVFSQTTHISGRIEKLFINTTGESVSKGQTIALIYSPELVTAQKELFEAAKIKDSNPELFEAAKEKLKNWKFTENQINTILKNGKPAENFPILSDNDGIVLQNNVNLGDHITQGNSLFEIADLSEVWVLFDVYESEMPWVKIGDEVEYTVQSLPNQIFKGTVEFIDPVLNPRTRVAKARIVAKNEQLNLKPEMFVSGSLSSPMKGQDKAIVIPKSSVMWTGKRSVVYVKSSETNGVSFNMRKVTLGASLGDSYIVLEGLEEGEEVATNGTFSIDAAAQLSGKPSMMNPEGGVAMTGHNHGNTQSNEKSEILVTPVKQPTSDETKKAIEPLFKAYFNMKLALVNDDFEKAKAAGNEIYISLGKVDTKIFNADAQSLWFNQSTSLKQNTQHIKHLSDIKAVRENFIGISKVMIAIAQSFVPIPSPIYIHHCQMADSNNGADWLSIEKEIQNPYFGQAMLKCGEVIKVIK